MIVWFLQITWILRQSPHYTLQEKFYSYYQWDSLWYRSIMTNGYISTIPPIPQYMSCSNVAFFPSYPLISRGLQWISGFEDQACLILTAQLAALGFWLFYFLILALWEIEFLYVWMSVLFLFTYHGSMYLVVGYSESTLLFTMVFFLFSVECFFRAKTHWGQLLAGSFAAISGMGMTLSKVTGAVVALYPILRSFCFALSEARNLRIQSLKRPVLCWLKKDAYFPVVISVYALSGMLFFFLFCFERWGSFDLYFWTQRVGWNNHPDFLALLKLDTYFSLNLDEWRGAKDLNSHFLNRLSVMVTVALHALAFGLEAIWEKRLPKRDFMTRLGLYFISIFAFLIPLSGSVRMNLDGMKRYCIPSMVTLLFAISQLLNQVSKRNQKQVVGLKSGFCLVAISLVFLKGHAQIASLFSMGYWVE